MTFFLKFSVLGAICVKRKHVTDSVDLLCATLIL